MHEVSLLRAWLRVRPELILSRPHALQPVRCVQIGLLFRALFHLRVDLLLSSRLRDDFWQFWLAIELDELKSGIFVKDIVGFGVVL